MHRKITVFSKSFFNGSVRRSSFSLYSSRLCWCWPGSGQVADVQHSWLHIVAGISSLNTRVLCWAHLSFVVLWAGSSTSPYHIPGLDNILTGTCLPSVSALGVWESSIILWSEQGVNQFSTFQILQVWTTQLEICRQLWISSIFLELEFWESAAWNGR